MKFLASVSLALAALAPFSELLMPSVGALPTHIKLEPRAQIRPRMGYSKKVRGVNLGGHFILEAWMSVSRELNEEGRLKGSSAHLSLRSSSLLSSLQIS